MIKVLVVDDSALVRKLFGRVLADEADFEVQFARNGVEALQQLESFRPTVVTLDILMPEMGGLECLDRIDGQRELVFPQTENEERLFCRPRGVRSFRRGFVPRPFAEPSHDVLPEQLLRAQDRHEPATAVTAIDCLEA